MLGLNLLKLDFSEINYDSFPFEDVCGIMFQYPNTYGNINFYEDLIQKCKENNILVSASCDLLSLVRLKSPKELGIDIAFGNSQRFGVPLWFGGPHPAYISGKRTI